MTFDRIKSGLARWSLPLQIAWLVLVCAFVGWKLYQIGWREVLRDLPATPWFYILYFAGYMVLPISEQRIFRLIWDRPIALVALLRKRALNNSVLGYSGDVYFYVWARMNLKLPDRRLVSGIKDSSVLSGIAGTLATLTLVAAFTASGRAGMFGTVMRGHERIGLAFIVLAVLAVPLAWRFRRVIFGISGRRAAAVFAIHGGRVLLVMLLQALQWWVAMPEAPATTWLLFLTLQALIGQLPLLPNRELLFLAVSLELSREAGVAATALSALMVASALLKQISNLGTLALTSMMRTPAVPREATVTIEKTGLP
jgi:hypothetical protein